MNRAALDRERADREFESSTPQHTSVENLGGEAGRTLQRAAEKQVGDPLLVDRGFDVYPAAEPVGVEPGFDLSLALGLEVDVADCALNNGGEVAGTPVIFEGDHSVNF